MRVGATPQAEAVVAQVRAAHPGDEFVFVFGSGCCEGTAPHLFAGYTLTPEQEPVGAVAGVGVFADTHVRRLANRLGLTVEDDPDKIERDLQVLLPPKEWTAFAHRLIHHGRRVCVARKPRCGACPLLRWCPQIGVKVSA